ncbi:MAG: phage virion morphogenesis protein [Ignavibacteria bacterium]|nr:phage virion morphogenesis protein [Ignavibacteria bacterium]
MNSLQEIQNLLNKVIQEIKVKGLKAIEIEAVKSIRKNFEVGGRPKWTPSMKKGKLIGTKTLQVTGALSQISAVRDDANSTVTLSTSPLARAYARIHQEGGTITMPARTSARRTKNDGRSVFASKNRDTGKRKKVDVSFSTGYTIKIPARPYLVIPPEDHSKILEQVKKAINL